MTSSERTPIMKRGTSGVAPNKISAVADQRHAGARRRHGLARCACGTGAVMATFAEGHAR